MLPFNLLWESGRTDCPQVLLKKLLLKPLPLAMHVLMVAVVPDYQCLQSDYYGTDKIKSKSGL